MISHNQKLAILFGLVLMMSCDSKTDYHKPQRMDITEAVYSSVTVQPDSLYNVFASVNGTIHSIHFDEGESVSQGSLLAKIDNTVPSLNVRNSSIKLDEARENAQSNSSILLSIKEELNTAKLRLQMDSVNYYRQEKLWNSGIGSKVELESKKLAYQSSKNQVEIVKSKLAQTKRDLNAQLKQALNLYKSASSSSSDFEITSLMNGKVYSILKNVGETVNPQAPIATIGSSNSFIIEMLIDEVDIIKVSEGQKIYLTLDAYQNTVFEAKINKIYPSKDLRTQTFLVEGVFTKAPNKLYPGLTGEANIVIQERKNALVIPNQFINDQKEVNTPEGMVSIETGIASLEYTEIIAGLDTSSRIIPLDQ